MIDRALSTVRPEPGGAVVHVEDVYDTSVEDLWAAITQPERLARWLGTVSGDLRVGGVLQLAFTSHWQGTGEVLECEPPNRVRLANREQDGSETEIEATIVAEGSGARLVVEEHGLPADPSAYAAGWQVHLEDLGAALAGRPTSDWHTRWRELIGSYRAGQRA